MLELIRRAQQGAAGAPAPDLISDYATIRDHEARAVYDHWFNEAAPITLGANAVDSVVVSFALPTGHVGILRNFAMGLENASDFDNVRWRLRVNRDPVVGFDNIVGQLSTFIVPVELLIPLEKNATVDVVVSNLTAAPITNVTALVRGTFFPGGS
jgi:hypothetical protein